MYSRKTLTPAPLPDHIPMKRIFWATPQSKTLPRTATAEWHRPLVWRTLAKRAIRSLTPPIIYEAAHRLRLALRGSPQAAAPSAPATARGSATQSRSDKAPDKVELEYGHVVALERRVPELGRFGFLATPSNASALLAFYNAYIPLIRDEARGAHLRSLLSDLRSAAPDLADKATYAIAVSDLMDGLPDRARILSKSPEHREEWIEQTAAFERDYGARIISEDWAQPSRGASLLHYLQAHSNLVVGKDVLHIAPEDELRTWLAGVCRCTTLDGRPDIGTDLAADVTSIPLPDRSFDVIICHRVLEHVLDDVTALKEFYRLLRPGGVLNLSVPQAAHRSATNEWLVQDRSHHDHVRHYGAHLREHIASVGFEVEAVTWLLNRPREELLAQSAYPLKMFNGTRPLGR